MSVQVVHSAVAQCIILKFLTNENVKPAELLKKIRAQFGVETTSRSQVYDWIKSLKKTEEWLKSCEHYTCCRGSYDQHFL